ncbi:MAG: type I-B CRISPR-associated protein Cas8b/Csh1 [Bacteroidota bacterium]
MQDRAITAIGRLELASQKDLAEYELFIEHPFPKEENFQVLLMVFDLSGPENTPSLRYRGIDLDRASTKNFQAFLYRKGASNGGDITFSTKSGDFGKKLRTLQRQIKNSLALAEAETLSADHALLLALEHEVETHKEAIMASLTELYASQEKKAQSATLLSMKFRRGTEDLFLQDFEIFRRQILRHGISGKFSKYSVESRTRDQCCAICLQVQPEIFGFASPFKYATVDKSGFVAGFFDQRQNWKNYPICSGCATEFELGKRVVNTRLRKSFYGKPFFMVPKAVIKSDTAALKKACRRIEEIDYEKANWLKTQENQFIQEREDYVMKLLGQEENTFSMSLLFFEENPTTKAISITLMLEEVFPSTFRRLFIELPQQINEKPIYKGQLVIKKQRLDLLFNFGLFKSFFPDLFLDMIHKVFRQESVPRVWLLERFMKVIRENYNKKKSSDGFVEPLIVTILKAHMLLSYFHLLTADVDPSNSIDMTEEMDLFTPSPGQEEPKQARSFMTEKFQQFVLDHPDFFQESYHQGIFAVGILVRYLFDYQLRDLNNTPFENKLQGLNLNADGLQKVYVAAIDKLSQYQKGFFKGTYQDLRTIIQEHFSLQIAHIRLLTNHEISFYFVAGLEMGRQFKNKDKSTETNPS